MITLADHYGELHSQQVPGLDRGELGWAAPDAVVLVQHEPIVLTVYVQGKTGAFVEARSRCATSSVLVSVNPTRAASG